MAAKNGNIMFTLTLSLLLLFLGFLNAAVNVLHDVHQLLLALQKGQHTFLVCSFLTKVFPSQAKPPQPSVKPFFAKLRTFFRIASVPSTFRNAYRWRFCPNCPQLTAQSPVRDIFVKWRLMGGSHLYPIPPSRSLPCVIGGVSGYITENNPNLYFFCLFG